MSDAFTKRCSAGIILVVLIGFWLALSPVLPGMENVPRVLKPVPISATPGSKPQQAAPEASTDQASDSTQAASSPLRSALAKATVPAGAISPIGR